MLQPPKHPTRSTADTGTPQHWPPRRDGARAAKLTEATDSLRGLILAGECYRQGVATYLGVGVTDTIAISNLAVHGSLGQTELADLLGRTTSSVTSMVDRLQTAGFVERTSDPDDRRRAVIKLTASGSEALRRSRDWFAIAFDQIPTDALPQTIELIEVLTTGLRRSAEAIATDGTDAP